VRLKARLLAKIDQVPRGQLAEFEEVIAGLVSGDRQDCERSSKQADNPSTIELTARVGRHTRKGVNCWDQYEKTLPCRFLQTPELVVPKSLAELGRFIARTFLVGPNNFRGNQKPARHFE
jgi:hypothetical protein